MNTFLTVVSFILRLVFGIAGLLAGGYYIYFGAQLLSWKDKDIKDILYGIFSIVISILFITIGLVLIVSLFF